MSNESVDIIEHPEFLEFVVTGDPTEEEWIALMHDIQDRIEKTDKPHIYIDASGLVNRTDSMVRYRMGIRTGETFGIHARIAVLRPVWDDDNFWETVATNRGAFAKSGDDRDTLIAWLLSDE